METGTLEQRPDAATAQTQQPEERKQTAQYVTKRNGKTEVFIAEKINNAVERACDGLQNASASEIVLDAQIKLYDGVTTEEIDEALIISARSKIEKEPDYSYAAARLLLGTIYKEVFGDDPRDDLKTQYAECFKQNLQTLIDNKLIDPRLGEQFDLDRLASALQPERDLKFKYLGLQTVYDRYLVHIRKRRMETPQAFFMRVAMGLALREDDPEARAIEFYNVLSNFYALSSTPTLFNSGTTHPQLSSCFLNTFEDSIDGIFDGLWQEARKSKFAGGLGYDITPWRSRGSFINGTNGENQGAVFFWKLYNDMLVAVNQGGKRKGAGCAYLETWHGDLEDFLNLRKNTGDDRVRTHDMNTANWIPDLFMKQVLNDEPWYLFSPSEAPELHDTFGEEFESWYWHYVEKGQNGELDVFEEKSAKALWKKMLRTLFETGHPWITFKDPSNIRYANQHEGVVHSSNLCTEILEHTKPSRYENGKKLEVGETAVCNLASLNLKEHTSADGSMNWEMLGRTVKTVMRMLDNVIDINFYPTEEAQKSNQRHRYVGMGSMGWHDVFHANNVPVDSDEAVRLSDDIYEFISRNAIMASSELAKERGTYPSYDGSLWSQNIFPIDTYADVMHQRGDNAIQIGDMQESLEWTQVREHVKQHGMRNALTMAIAPTATISFIAGCAQSTEPNFSVLFVYSTLSGEFVLIDENFVRDMKALGKWDNDMVKLLKSVDGDVEKLPDSVVPPEYKAKYKTAFNCDQSKLLEAGAARQKWIDQGCSLNLYNNSTSLKFMNDIYTHAWQLGLKTTYYLRNMGASKVEKSTIDDNEVQRILADKNGETGQSGIQSSGGDFECIGCQ